LGAAAAAIGGEKRKLFHAYLGSMSEAEISKEQKDQRCFLFIFQVINAAVKNKLSVFSNKPR